MIITIDGPASVGKGTLASKLANFYGFEYFDTGMVYRAVGLEILLNNLDINNEAVAEEVAKKLTFSKMMKLSESPEFRGAQGGINASIVAKYPSVRAALLKMQQDFAVKSKKGVVYDGRDTGTVVCPHADLKIFVTARSEVRAMRRYKEFEAKGINITYEQVLKDVMDRDDRDMNRAVAPLKPAVDAVILDNSDINQEETFEIACKLINSRIKA